MDKEPHNFKTLINRDNISMKKPVFNHHPINSDVAALLLRVIFGGLIANHGYAKFSNYSQMTTMFPDLIGIGTETSLILVIFAELVCGVLIVLGLVTRLAVVLVFIAMVVAFFIAHGKDPFQMKELAFLFMTLSFVLFILGSGRYSVDKLLFGRDDTY